MIGLEKKYKTRDGRKVILHEIKERNDCGDLVTFPVKGSIVLRDKPLKLEFTVWTAKGVWDDIWHKHSEWDLIEEVAQ